MKVVIQRVSRARVNVKEETVGEINNGLLVLLGVEKEDNINDIKFLVNKIINLRIFADESGKFNLSLKDINGEILIVSQFTLLADCKKGRRPSFEMAAKSDLAQKLYEKFIDECKTYNIKVETGKFQTIMDVELCNQGPVTIIIDSKE